MAELRGGTTIGGFTALHSGLANAFLGGNLRIAGSVGIGTLNPAQKLHVYGDTDTRIRIDSGTSNASAVLELTNKGLTNYVFTDSNGLLMAYTGTSGKHMALQSNNTASYVGIGTTAPTYKLQVEGDIYATGWLRAGGQQGLYFQSYGGGWYMTDTTWIRSYGSKPVNINAYLNVGPNANNSAAGGIALGSDAVDYTPTTGNWTGGGTTLLLNALNYSVIGFHDAGSRVDFIRVGGSIIEIGYNGGWGNAVVKVPGRLVIPVGTDMYSTV